MPIIQKINFWPLPGLRVLDSIYLLKSLLFLSTNVFADSIPSYKLIVDNGRYQESEWVRQLAVTADDKYLIVSDFSSGVKIYEVETGKLINVLEGHSLEGDSYFDKKNNLFITTGDKKIKIWDISKQKLLKQINQSFHSQFMHAVYIDSKKKYVFAQGIKYDYATKAVVKKYSFGKMYFFNDMYWLFDRTNGILASYSVYDDKPVGTIRIDQYVKGYNIFFNEMKGILFIGYTDGVRTVDVSTGKSEIILFDRSRTYDNLSICSNFEYSQDRGFFLASSTQGEDMGTGGHFVVLKKDAGTNNYLEVFRDKVRTNEIIALTNSNRCIVSGTSSFQLFDFQNLSTVWKKEESLYQLSRVNGNRDQKFVTIESGVSRIHLGKIKLAAGKNYDGDYVNRYFDLMELANIETSLGYAKFKENLDPKNIPAELLNLWRNSTPYFNLNIQNDLKIAERKPKFDIVYLGSIDNSPYNPIEGKIYSPSQTYYATEKSFSAVTFYKNDQKVVTAPTSGVIYHIEYSKDEKLAAFGGSDRTVTVVDLVQKKKLYGLNGNSYITSICFSNDNRYVFSGSLKNEILMHDLATGKLVRRFTGSNGGIADLHVTPNSKLLISVAEDNALRFWDIRTGTLQLTAYYDYDFNYIAFTPSGYFDKSEKFGGSISWNVDGNNISFDQLYENYYRPDIIKATLNSEDVTALVKNSIQKGVKSPPQIQISFKKDGERGAIESTNRTSSGITTVNILAKNTGGGIRGIRVYNNKKLVGEHMIESGQTTDPSELSKDFAIDLVKGENVLLAVGFASDMTESKGSTVQLTYIGNANDRPSMYIIAIGINEYKNPKYNLNYCVADMEGFTESLKTIGKDLFKEIHVKAIRNADATKDNLTKIFSEYAQKIQPTDVFTFFYAGHGIALNALQGESTTDFFYVLSDVTQMTDASQCIANGISGSEMRHILARIKANKQLLFIDACNSGAFAEQYRLRGAAEEIALAKLSRATGSIIFASTTKEQNAAELGALKHGIFTYVLIEALSGEAALANCQITAASIKGFVDDKIPAYTEKYGGQQQFPTTYMWGQDFPLGIKCKNR